jgi:hypothetical protein
VATPEGVIDLENWGADATKVGVGPGQGVHHQAQDVIGSLFAGHACAST